ncbi:MAG TPA: carbon-nitrogen hydrolase family protein [Ktedonobacteraceae bacterium]|jgi:predicted amidohydrolase
MQINIAVVQFAIAQFAADINLARAERFIQEAVAQQADIVLFPEDCVLGPLNGRPDLADFDQRYIRHFQELAARYHVDLVPGSLIEGEESGLYNTTYYIDRAGEILGRYRKVHLWLPERSYLDPGQQTVVCQTRFGRVGLAICWDLAFPEHFRAMVARGADLVLCPSYWCYEDAGCGLQHNPDAEITFVDALCTARAFEQEIILAYANAAGELDLGGEHATLIGHSQITTPFKGALYRCEHNHEALFVQAVQTEILADAEAAYEIRQDLRKGLFPTSA